MNTPPQRLSALVIAGRLPWPVDDGWKMRTYNILRGMAADGITVELAVFVDPGEPPATIDALRNICSAIYPVVRRSEYGIADLIKGVVGCTPFSVHNYSVPEMHTLVARLGRERSYDFVMIEDIVMAPYVRRLPAAVKFLDMHNIESHLLLRYAEQERRLARKRYAVMTARKLARFEKMAASWFDRIFACSAEDRQLLEQMPVTTKVEVMPNGIDPHHYSCFCAEPEDGSIVFVGSMDYHANISGVTWFVAEVLPFVLAEKPDLKFYIVGKNPPPVVQKLACASVIVTGAVADVRPYLSRAAVVVVPLLVGGGTRLKILEAMAMGKAVVSTSLGCEGIDVTDGENIVIADDQVDFSRHLLSLYDNVEQRNSLGERAALFVVEKYSWNDITKKIGITFANCAA